MADGTIKISTMLDGSGLKKGLQSLGTVAAGALGGMAALITKATMAAGELEQNLGGAESVFGDLGNSVAEMTTVMQTYDKELGQVVTSTTSLEEVAQSAFQNMGLSTSDFLATANKMGALFQGSGFSAQESLDLSARAMQRAADVASIMGIDTAAALEAVTGAAKGNFTMMDNLGVAMNATTIEAYALSKGINTAYKDMDNQQKIGLAMELFLEKTAYAAGNYAKENMTLAGSLGTAKAALTNFLDGSGDVDALVGAFVDAADVIIANVTEIAPRIIDGISQIVAQALPLIPGMIEQVVPVVLDGATQILNALVAMVPALVDGFAAIFPQLGSVLGQLIDVIIDTLPEFLDAAAELVYAILDGLAKAGPELVPLMLEITFRLIDVITDTLPEFIEVAGQMIVSIVRGLVQSLPQLVEKAPEIVNQLLAVLVESLPLFIDMAAEIIMTLADGLIVALPMLIEKAPELIESLLLALFDCLPLLIEVGIEIITKLLSGIDQAAVALVKKVPDLILVIVNGFQAANQSMLDCGWNLVKGIWEGISGASGWLRSKISEFASGVVESIKEFFGIHSPSVVMEKEVGAMITAGLAKGIIKGANVPIEATRQLAEQLRIAAEAAISSDLALSVSAAQSAAYGLGGQIGVGENRTVNVTQNFYSQTTSSFDAYKGAVLVV